MRLIAFVIGVLMGDLVLAKTSTLFVLNFTNYHADQTVHFELEYDETSCTMRGTPGDSLLQAYFVGPNLERSELSGPLQTHLEPKVISVTSTEISFSNLAIDTFNNNIQKPFTTTLTKSAEGCLLKTLADFENQKIEIRSIFVELKKILSIPTAVEWARVIHWEEDQSKESCVFGSCNR